MGNNTKNTNYASDVFCDKKSVANIYVIKSIAYMKE